MNTSAKSALGRLKIEHRSLGLMISELDTAIDSLEGQELLNAIDTISSKYNFPTA